MEFIKEKINKNMLKMLKYHRLSLNICNDVLYDEKILRSHLSRKHFSPYMSSKTYWVHIN